uniref:Glycosyl transferase family 25 domain-containing protein n=1 Tax=Malurus cyaneus samueli TaxID=2593467 RepID=A0A8C5TBE5_9PASS
QRSEWDTSCLVWKVQEEPSSYPDELGPKHWSDKRYENVMRLKQEALTYAREQQADYILFMDTDSILTNNQTLKFLMAQNKSVVAPMLDSQTFYSNFWCGITPQGYYRRTADYFPTKNRQRVGCFRVPMVYATFLIDLRKEETSRLAFYPPHPNYTWAFDDIIVFAYSCQEAGAEVHVCNQHRFGYINVPVKAHQTLEDDRANFVHLTLEAMVDGPPMQRSRHISLLPRPLTKMGFDEVSAQWSHLCDHGGTTHQSPGPLSLQHPQHHYNIWKEIVSRGLERSVVFEDDVRFEAAFPARLQRLMEELEQAQQDWDLIYLGRKQVNDEDEAPVEGVRNLVVAGYSYWTLAYAISHPGGAGGCWPRCASEGAFLLCYHYLTRSPPCQHYSLWGGGTGTELGPDVGFAQGLGPMARGGELYPGAGGLCSPPPLVGVSAPIWSTCMSLWGGSQW